MLLQLLPQIPVHVIHLSKPIVHLSRLFVLCRQLEGM